MIDVVLVGISQAGSKEINSPQGEKRKLNENTTVIIGRATQILSPTGDFLQNCDSYIGNVQRKSVLPRQDSKK